MDSSNAEIAHDFFPMARLYTDGRIERLRGTATVPPSLDPKTNVESKDVVYSTEPNLSARLYIPKSATHHTQKLPLVIYFHGGGFIIETAFSPTYHNHLNTLVAEANVIAVSVDYRLAPEHPLPAAYDDSWAALKWVASHSDGNGPEDWINRHADLQNVFFAGDSAGANIAHHMAIRVGKEKNHGKPYVDVEGIILVHPYFLGKDPIGEEASYVAIRSMIEVLWRLSCPGTSGLDDPLINVCADGSSLARLACRRVLVCVAEKDGFRQRGLEYCEKVRRSGWGGAVEMMESEGENHVFHLLDPTRESVGPLLKTIVDFIRHDHDQ